MRLYLMHRCPYAHRAAMALREKGVPFELVFFERGKRPPELEAVGPRARSPSLIDGERKVYDSGVVLEYLEDRFPERALLPREIQARADVRMLIARFNDEINPKYSAALGAVRAEPRDEEKVAAAKKAFLDALPAWDEYFAGRTYAVGDAFTLADITVYTLFPSIAHWARVEIPESLGHLRAWYDRVRARPSAPLPTPS